MVISTSIEYVFALRAELCRALAIPSFALILIISIGYPNSELGLTAIFLGILEFVIYTLIAVTTHRLILLGPGSVPKWGLRKITKRELKFILYTLGLFLMLILPAQLILIPYAGWILAILGMCYLLGRFSLIFPAIATDKKWSFQKSWRATQPHQIMMIVIVFIFPVIIAIPETFLSNNAYTEFISLVISVITEVFVIAALSMAFKVIEIEASAERT